MKETVLLVRVTQKFSGLINQAAMREREPVVASRCTVTGGESVDGLESLYCLWMNSQVKQAGLSES